MGGGWHIYASCEANNKQQDAEMAIVFIGDLYLKFDVAIFTYNYIVNSI